ncbi:MAG: RHS repeat-associated core domain-containing protein, partial [Saprospiraceae bacterium]
MKGYYGARFYDPTIRRFINPDSVSELAPGWTPYRYGFNNPIRYIDPNGMFETEADAKKYAKDNNIKVRKFN